MKRLAFGLVLLVVALAGALTLAPAQLTVLNNIVVLALFGVATNLLIGYGGLISFGQGCFYGLGAYIVAIAWFHRLAPFWLAALIAPFAGAFAAFVVGLLALRTRRWYFALLTLAFSQLFFTVAEKAYTVTQGDSGIFGAMVPDALSDPTTGSLFIVIVAAVAIFALWRITESPLGLMLRAIRENERRVMGLGVGIYRTQLLAFTLSGFFCAIAGVLAAVNQQAAYPDMLDWLRSGDAVLVAVVGGMYAFLGPVLGAIVYQLGHDVTVRFTTHWELALGLVLLFVVLAFPDGLAGLFGAATWRRVLGRLRPVRER